MEIVFVKCPLVILEPIMWLEVVTPDANMGDIN